MYLENIFQTRYGLKNVHRKVSKLLEQNKNICITDIRFKNEFNFVKKYFRR